MNALHVLGAGHSWSNVPMFVVLGLFLIPCRNSSTLQIATQRRPQAQA
jgi:hypothetical protein